MYKQLGSLFPHDHSDNDDMPRQICNYYAHSNGISYSQLRTHWRCELSMLPEEAYIMDTALYWLLRLYRRPTADDYLLCDTGTLALRVHVVMPGAHIRPLFMYVYRPLCVCCTPASRWRMRASMRGIQQCKPLPWVFAPLLGATFTIQ